MEVQIYRILVATTCSTVIRQQWTGACDATGADRPGSTYCEYLALHNQCYLAQRITITWVHILLPGSTYYYLGPHIITWVHILLPGSTYYYLGPHIITWLHILLPGSTFIRSLISLCQQFAISLIVTTFQSQFEHLDHTRPESSVTSCHVTGADKSTMRVPFLP